MKLRNGFVSNSSSSSFIVIVEKKAYDETYKKSHPFVQAVMSYLSKGYNFHKKEFLGKDVLVVGKYSSAGGDYTFDNFSYNGPIWDPENSGISQTEWEDELCYMANNALDEFISDIPEGEYITASVGDGG